MVPARPLMTAFLFKSNIMKRKKKPTSAWHPEQLTITETGVLKFFSSSSFLSVNKSLLKKFGPEPAIWLSAIIDRYLYLTEKKQIKDNWFYFTHDDQIKETNISEYGVKKSKKLFKDLKIIKTKYAGLPKKEWYRIDTKRLANAMSIAALDPTNSEGQDRASSGGQDPTNSEGQYYNINYNNNETKDNETKDISAKKSKPTIKERNKKFLPFAEYLAKIVKQNKKINTPTRRLKSWANDIRKLNEVEGVAPARIKKALKWYRKNIGGQYIPVIESGSSLRSKFAKLEAAMERAKKPNNQKRTSIGYQEGYKHKTASREI